MKTLPAGSRVHLVGIGGMHMSAIAQILLADGIRVSGSDLAPSALTDRLQTLGATFFEGHAATNVGAADLLVATAAARSDNPELVEARRRGIPVLIRHEMVARLMEGRTAVAVAGTHGKTTTTSLLALMLQEAGRRPAYLLGGESLDLGGNAAPGGGEHVVVEADEYAGAFLAYHPNVAIVTNVEPDHLDYFGSEAKLLDAFGQFMANVLPDGLLIASRDSPLLQGLVERAGPPIRARIERYSLEREADWRAEGIERHAGGGSNFIVCSRRGSHGRFRTGLPGAHIVSNALAAIAAGNALGLDDETMRTSLAGFRGARRRFELVGDVAGITIVDDYAHHPTEVRVNLEAARLRYPDRRLVVLFQPHTYSRTAYLLDGWRTCFVGADRLLLLQTFAARETAAAGLDARALAGEIRTPRPTFVQSIEAAVEALASELRSGDVCLTMGAGDVTRVGPLLREALRCG